MNINVFGIPNFEPWFLARRSDETLPGSVRDNLSDKEEKRLLEIIKEFEKSPTDIEAKEKKYTELMKLFYKGIGLKEDGTGTISPKNERAALELSGLINDAILQDQQNISGKYSPEQLNKALKLQDKFRKNLELQAPDFKRLLIADTGKNNELSAGKNDYQTEKITSYLAENKKDFTEIFQELSKSKPDLKKLTETQKGELENLKTLAGKGNQDILSTILSTFKEFKDYRFTNPDLTRMKKTDGTELRTQANTESTPDNWERVENTDKPDSEEDDGKEKKTSRRESNKTDKTLERILARLEKLEKRCAEKDTDTDEKQASTTPDWLGAITAGLGIAEKFLKTTGLGNNNQNYCCYPPVPCSGRGSAYCPPASYSGGGSAYCPPRPYYVGDDTYPWGRVIGSNGAGINGTSAFNNYMPSSGSYSTTSNPSSTSSSNPYSNINIELNPVFKPVFNNNPIQSSASYSGSRSINEAEIRRSFGIDMPGIRRT